ncbi:hypothetical protein TSOC_005989, partial [Tetrabaena socialis]
VYQKRPANNRQRSTGGAAADPSRSSRPPHPQKLRTDPSASAALASAPASDPDPEDQPQSTLQFVSSERAARPAPPERRIPICFPRMTLQMLRLGEQQVALLKERGWLREVAFKTSPHVTKLEVSAFLEAVYGMSVERVSTINYLGRRRLTYTNRGKKLEWREDDWKKAYEEEDEEGAEEGRPVIERIRAAARAPRRAPKPYPWEGRAKAKQEEGK